MAPKTQVKIAVDGDMLARLTREAKRRKLTAAATVYQIVAEKLGAPVVVPAVGRPKKSID